MSFFEEVEMAKSQEWEYMVLSGDITGVLKANELSIQPKQMWHEYLDEEGRRGWEVAGVTGFGASALMVILKRPV